MMPEILYISKNAVVIYKPAGIPSQSDLSGDSDAMTLTRELLTEQGEDTTLYLIHRLDRVVGGLLIFARNKQSAARLSEMVATDGIGKEYLAVTDGYLDGGEMRDLIFRDARQSKAFIVDRERGGVKEALLEHTPITSANTDRGVKTLVRVKLHTGRFHQIRAQFSHRDAPLTGDKKYGSRDVRAHAPSLFSYRISLELFDEKIEVEKLPPINKYPWNLFSAENYIIGN